MTQTNSKKTTKKSVGKILRSSSRFGGARSHGWHTFSFIDLFAGIGGMRIAFERMGGQCVFSCEWDEAAQKTYEANFGEIPAGDITKIASNEIPDHDLLLAGFPCQPFSIIGDMNGFSDTRGTLFFDIERILRDKAPAAFLLENVKQLTTHDNRRTFSVILEKLHGLKYHVHWRVLNALDFGVPQKRERVFVVGFKDNVEFSFPEPFNRKPRLEDILENDDDVDPFYFASDKIRKQRLGRIKIKPPRPSVWHENKGGNISPLPFSCALRAGASHNYLLVNGVRRLTSREMLRLQGFPDSFKIVVPYRDIRQQAGNSVAVPCVAAVAERMLVALRSAKPATTAVQQLLFAQENI